MAPLRLAANGSRRGWMRLDQVRGAGSQAAALCDATVLAPAQDAAPEPTTPLGTQGRLAAIATRGALGPCAPSWRAHRHRRPAPHRRAPTGSRAQKLNLQFKPARIV
jgi:hypothetical protein